jgi:hypothetical protein
MNESTRVQKTNSKRILVALILIAVVAVAGVAYLYRARAPTTPENVRKDLALREGAATVGLAFLWASDVGDRESDKELKQLIYQVNEVFDPVQVYFWLHNDVVLTKTSVEVYQGREADCTLEISDDVHKMVSATDIPIIVIRDIPDNGTYGLACSFPIGCWPRPCLEQYDVRKSYIILDPETMRSTIGYRVLTHEILHVLLKDYPPEPEWVVYATFPVDDLSYKVIVSDYERIHQSAESDYGSLLPEDYDAFS